MNAPANGKEDGAMRREVYIRICRDSGFSLPYDRAAALTGQVTNTHPMQVWAAFPYLSAMQEIATGESRFLRENGGRY